MNCYYYDTIQKNMSTWDAVIDGCFILIMENSKHKENIYKNIIPNVPVSKIFVQYNKGFRKCEKENIDRTDKDLAYSLKVAFQKALSMGMKRVLVLEEDVLFDDRIQNKEITDDIKQFISIKNPDVYNLGTLFNFSNLMTIWSNHLHSYYMSFTHAVIYSEMYMKDFIKNNTKNIHTDVYFNKFKNKYLYKIPIVYQLFEKTENTDNWNSLGINWYSVSKFVIFDFYKLDKQAQPGFDKVYEENKKLHIFILLILSILFVKYLEKYII